MVFNPDNPDEHNQTTDIMTPHAVAEYLGVSAQLVYQKLKSGDIPSRRIGERWIISRRKLIEWIEGGE